MSAAAVAYFGKRGDGLRSAEVAYIAVLAAAPAMPHPARDRDLARTRRDFVLLQIVKTGALSEAEATAARASTLAVVAPLRPCAAGG